MNYKKLSKTMAYALRHAPEKFGLTLAEDGSVPLKDLIASLRRKRFPNLQKSDIEAMIKQSDKKRFAIEGERIRATYGHSVQKKIIKEARKPPQSLYHGTSRRALPKIQKEGLRPMGRQYVHLSSDLETAEKVGRRHDPHPVLLEVSAARAHADGIRFYPAADGTWNSDPLPPAYLKFIARK